MHGRLLGLVAGKALAASTSWGPAIDMRRLLKAAGLASILALWVCLPIRVQAVAEQKNIVLVSHNDLNGHGDGGEGNQLGR